MEEDRRIGVFIPLKVGMNDDLLVVLLAEFGKLALDPHACGFRVLTRLAFFASSTSTSRHVLTNSRSWVVFSKVS